MEHEPRNRFAGRLVEKNEEDVAEATEFTTLLYVMGGGVPAVLGLFAVVYFILKTMAVQAPFLFAGVLAVTAGAVFVGWRTIRTTRDP